MFRLESDLRDYIKECLVKRGHEVNTEVTIYKGYRIDLLVTWKSDDMNENNPDRKVGKKEAIEVKVERYDILDGISYANELKKLPMIDFCSVAAPSIFCGEDEVKFSSMLNIGLLSVSENEVKYLITPRLVPQFSLGKSYSVPNIVNPGDEFTIRYSLVAKNKIAANVQVEYTPSGPFRQPQAGKNRSTIIEIPPNEREDVELYVKVREESKSGIFPLLIKIQCEGMKTEYDLLQIQIKKKIEQV